MKNHPRHVLIVLSLSLLISLVQVGCGSSDDEIGQQDIPPASENESLSEPGLSRSNPFPTYEQVSVPGWDLQILEIHRGEDAMALTHSDQGITMEPPPGMEHIAVKLFLRCTHLDEDWHDIAPSELFITGERGIAYRDYVTDQPAPELFFENFYVAQTMEAWIDAFVPEDEGNLILSFEKVDWDNDGQKIKRYIALDEGASISLPDLRFSPNEIGGNYSTAAPLGEYAITENWKIKVLEVLRGEDALVVLQEASEINQPLEGEQEYLLVKAEINYLSTQEGGVEIVGSEFFVVDSQQNHHWAPYYDLPRTWRRPWIYVTLYPWASYEGWIILTAPKNDTDILLGFNPQNEGSTRYFSLAP
jgi:hypothetical protein